MRPKWHILFGFVISYILIYFFNFPLAAGITIFLSSFLIDVDHYLLYVYKTKKISLKGAYFWCVERGKKFEKLPKSEKVKYKLGVIILHGIEFVSVLFLLSFLSHEFLWILIGILIHLSADLPDLYIRGFPLREKISPIYTYITNKKKKELR